MDPHGNVEELLLAPAHIPERGPRGWRKKLIQNSTWPSWMGSKMFIEAWLKSHLLVVWRKKKKKKKKKEKKKSQVSRFKLFGLSIHVFFFRGCCTFLTRADRRIPIFIEHLHSFNNFYLRNKIPNSKKKKNREREK